MPQPNKRRGRGAAAGGARLTPPSTRKHTKRAGVASPATTWSSTSSRPPVAAAPQLITDGEVQWAAVQVDEAAERLRAAGHALLTAHRELADRTLLATKMSEARALGVSAARLTELAEQRQRDAALAKELAKQAAQRKQEADQGLDDVRAKEREAMEAVAELQSSIATDGDSDA